MGIEKILGKIFSRSKQVDVFAEKIGANKTKIKVKIDSIFGLEQGSVKNVGLFNDAKTLAEVDTLTNSISKERGTLTLPVYSRAARAEAKNSIQTQEKTFFGEMLDEYKTLKPPKREVNPYTETETIVQKHINGDTTNTVYDLDRKLDETLSSISLTSNGKRFSQSFGKSGSSVSQYGDKELISEFNAYLNGKPPTLELFNDFVNNRNIKYLKDNAITNLKDIKISIAKGNEVERLAKKHHDEVQKKYDEVWRSYPTEQFYRVAGMDELRALLRGETIVSKNSVARYGRPCVDITPNGYYHDIYYGEQKVRIPFKRKDPDGGWHERFTSKIRPFREENAHYQVSSYDFKDVDFGKLTYWDGSDWKPLDVRKLIKA